MRFRELRVRGIGVVCGLGLRGLGVGEKRLYRGRIGFRV